MNKTIKNIPDSVKRKIEQHPVPKGFKLYNGHGRGDLSYMKIGSRVRYWDNSGWRGIDITEKRKFKLTDIYIVECP